MPTKSAAVLASGTANAAKLFVAALAFTSAYVGFSAFSTADSVAEPVTKLTLSSREVPITEQLASPGATAGRVTVSLLTGGDAGCATSYVARGLVVDPDADQAVHYRWRLVRWSPATKTWRTYLSDHDGFAAAEQAVEWRPQISGNPGWYRVELSVESAKSVKSARFQVSC